MRRLLPCIVLSGSIVPLPVVAQQPPDAGRATQELRSPPQPPAPTPELRITTPPTAPVEPGGPQVWLRSVVFEGNTRFDDARLHEALGDVTGRAYDLAGLRMLADRLAAYYRAWDHPFARVIVPAQAMVDGQLRLQVIEGRYGRVVATGDAAVAAGAAPFLRSLRPGDRIEGIALERAVLVLADQPGHRIEPIVRPGEATGTGDLAVAVARTERFAGDLGIDNHGNRYTGRHRGRANFHANSALLFGDQVSLRGLYTDERLWFGSLAYAAPIGGSGLRGNAGLARTSYELGKEFASLGATGTADVASAGLSYPLWRSQRASAVLSATYVEKRLRDQRSVAGASDDKRSRTTPVAVSFDVRDGWMGGGVTWGAFAVTQGTLDVGASLDAIDAATARTAGHFHKANLDLARLQSLPLGFTFFGRFSKQIAGDNLDASERFGLGGISGVRAYPVGEGFGDEGWFAQAEVRAAFGPYQPYVFHDAGAVRINKQQWTPGNNRRAVQGAGVGLRYTRGAWQSDVAAAWRTAGGEAQSDTKNERPMLWFSVGYRF